MKAQTRETFGIYDRKGTKYPDILGCHLKARVFTPYYLKMKTIWEQGIEYSLHIDSVLRRSLKETGSTKVIISFQNRTDGNFAFARIYIPNKDRRNNHGQS